MKKLIFIFLLLPLLCFAQVDIQVGAKIKNVDFENVASAIFKNQLVYVGSKGSLIKVATYDINSLVLNPIKEIECLPAKCEVKRIICLNGKAIIFYTQTSIKQNNLFGTSIDLESGNIVAKDVAIFKTESPIVQDYYGKRYSYEISSDSSKILCQYTVKPVIKDDSRNKSIIGLYTIDNKLNILFSKEMEMPYVESRMYIINSMVSNQGTPYILTSLKEENIEDAKIKLNLLKPEDNASKWSELLLDNQAKQSLSVLFKESTNQSVVIANYYAESKGKDCSNGLLVYKIDKDKTVGVHNYEIPLEVCNKYISEKQIQKNLAKGFGDIPNLALRNLNIEKDGSILIIGEQHKEEWGETLDGRKLLQYYYDILTVKIASDNKLPWMVKLPKRQVNKDVSNDILSISYLKVNNNF